MGSTCVGKQRDKSELMRQKSQPQKRYINYQSNKVKKEVVIGESQGAQIKINKGLITCSICMQNYNTTKRQPVIACQNHHTYCRECMDSISPTNRKCPECRNPLLALIRNRDIYQLVEDNQKQFEENKIVVVEEAESSFLALTVDQNNKFIDNFWIEGNRVMKIQSNLVWLGFLSSETIIRDRQCIFAIKVISSKFNNIEIGVVGKGYQIEQNITCKQSVVYHLADGMILEGVPGRKSQWKAKGQKISSGAPFVIETRVNIPNKTISWHHGQKQLGQTRLSDHILNYECVVYVLMSHTEDIIQLNG